ADTFTAVLLFSGAVSARAPMETTTSKNMNRDVFISFIKAMIFDGYLKVLAYGALHLKISYGLSSGADIGLYLQNKNRGSGGLTGDKEP
ncbi:MAG: hypothetical protein WB392_07455, partial [Methanotrichaceae archaeon]